MVEEFKSTNGITYRLFAQDLSKERAEQVVAGVPKHLSTRVHEYSICGEARIAVYIQTV
jgi:hypothetical protein